MRQKKKGFRSFVRVLRNIEVLIAKSKIRVLSGGGLVVFWTETTIITCKSLCVEILMV